MRASLLILFISAINVGDALAGYPEDVASAQSAARVDEAAEHPFLNERGNYVINPDLAYSVALDAVAGRTEPKTEEGDLAFIHGLIASLQARMPFIQGDRKLYNNVFENVLGEVYVLYANKNEYLITYRFKEARNQMVKPFIRKISAEARDLVAREGLGYSGIYPQMDIRTITLTDLHVTLRQDGELHVHKPGDRAYLPRGQWKAYKSGWILECGQGSLWRAVPHFTASNKGGDIAGQLGAMVRGTWYKWWNHSADAARSLARQVQQELFSKGAVADEQLEADSDDQLVDLAERLDGVGDSADGPLDTENHIQ